MPKVGVKPPCGLWQLVHTSGRPEGPLTRVLRLPIEVNADRVEADLPSSPVACGAPDCSDWNDSND